MRTTTRSFKSGNSIAVRIPAKFSVEPGTTFEIRQRGGELVLSPREEDLSCLIEIFRSMPADFMSEGRDNAPPQERDFAIEDAVPNTSKATRAKKSGSTKQKRKTA